MSRREPGACPMFPTVRQAVRYTGASEHWIREQVRAGTLPTYQLDDKAWPWICLEEVVALIRSTRTMVESPASQR